MSTNLIAETLAKHQPNTTEGGGPYIVVQCACDRTFRAWQFHAIHQADAVREALLSDEAVHRIHVALIGNERESLDAMAEIAIAALIGGEQ